MEKTILPASRLQEQLYQVYRKNPLTTEINLAFAFRTKNLNVGKLEWALNQIIARHENLRSNFFEDNGRLWQSISPSRRLKVASFSADDLRTFIRPFALQSDLLLRAAVKENLILLDFCHIITDGFSMAIFFRELDTLYSDLSPDYQAPAAADCQISSAAYEANKKFWQTLLQKPFLPHSLPADFPKKQAYGGRGGSQIAWLGAETTAAIRDCCKNLTVTPYIFYLTAFCRLLARHNRNQDVITGTNLACRGKANLRSIGLYTTMVPVRLSLSESMNTSDLLLTVNDLIRQILRHQHMDLSEILREKNLHDYRDIFPTLFTFEHEKMAQIRLGGKNCEFVPIPTKDSAFDCNLCCFPFKKKTGLLLIFRTDLFTPKHAAGYLDEYMDILVEMTETFSIPQKEKLQNSH